MATLKLICAVCNNPLDVTVDIAGELRVHPCGNDNCEGVNRSEVEELRQTIQDIKEVLGVKDKK